MKVQTTFAKVWRGERSHQLQNGMDVTFWYCVSYPFFSFDHGDLSVCFVRSQKCKSWGRKAGQWFNVDTAFAKGLSSFPSTYIQWFTTACTYKSMWSDTLLRLPLELILMLNTDLLLKIKWPFKIKRHVHLKIVHISINLLKILSFVKTVMNRSR